MKKKLIDALWTLIQKILKNNFMEKEKSKSQFFFFTVFYIFHKRCIKTFLK